MANKKYYKNIFINCPFDSKYKPMLLAMLFTIIYCGYEPRIASERSDSWDLRLSKIKELIRASKYSIHDLSRIKAEKKGDYSRSNMPFEMGLDYGCRVYGQTKHKLRQSLIMAEQRHEYHKALSDLAGIDIATHKSDEETLVTEVRNWIRSNLTKRDIDSGSGIWDQYNFFTGDFGLAMEDKGFKPKDIENLPISEFMDHIKKWIKAKNKH